MSAEKIATRDVYGEVLVELGEQREDIVVLDADLSKSTRTVKFAKRFPNRFFNMGIAEQNMIDTACGLAVSGNTVFASSFAIFASGRAWEQVRNSICYSRYNVKVVATHAGISVGEDGVSHQACEDVAIMRAIPNMRVFVPADAVETKAIIRTIAKDQQPVYVRLGRAKVPVIYDDAYVFHPGKASQLREGSDATFIAMGATVTLALEAAAQLAEQQISVRVINMSSIKPIDRDAILAASSETRAIVTIEEHNVIGGLGSSVAEVLVTSAHRVPMRMIGLQDTFAQSGSYAELFERYGLSTSNLIKVINEIL
jgi:transketolase